MPIRHSSSRRQPPPVAISVRLDVVSERTDIPQDQLLRAPPVRDTVEVTLP